MSNRTAKRAAFYARRKRRNGYMVFIRRADGRIELQVRTDSPPPALGHVGRSEIGAGPRLHASVTMTARFLKTPDLSQRPPLAEVHYPADFPAGYPKDEVNRMTSITLPVTTTNGE